MIAAGIIGALAAAIFGLIDWLAIPSGTRAKAVGQWHGLGNLVIVGLFVVCGQTRMPIRERSHMCSHLWGGAGARVSLDLLHRRGNARSGTCYNIVYPCRR
jgi:uncharacterized membrane protein